MAGTAPGPSTAAGAVLSGAAKAGIAIAVAVAVVAAALALGLVPGVHLFPSTSHSNGSSSSAAIGPANQTAASHDPGALIAVVGASTTYSFSFGEIPASLTACSVAGGLTSNVTVPAQGGSYSAGAATVWIFAYVNRSTPSETFVAVVGSTPYFLGQLTGAPCVNTTTPAITGPYESSSAAAGQLDGSAGAFLSAHGSANALYFLLENSTSDRADWGILYTNCSYDPATGNSSGGPRGDAFEGLVDAVSGAVLDSATALGSVECSTTGSPGVAPVSLAPSVFASGGSGQTWYVSVALDPSSPVATSEFGLKVTNASADVLPPAASVAGSGCMVGGEFSAGATGCAGPSAGWYAVLVNVTGVIVATYTLGGWSSSFSIAGGSYALEVLSHAQLDGEGYALTAYGTGSTPVSGEVTL